MNSLNKRPLLLYHGSATGGLTALEPRARKTRDHREGPVVFACADWALACAFIVPTDDCRVEKGTFGEAYHVVISDRSHFLATDRGGSVYTVPATTFCSDPDKGMGEREWVSRQAVGPIGEAPYRCGLNAMVENGVQVFFVGEQRFRAIRAAEDDGLVIIQSLPSENQLRGVNVRPLLADDTAGIEEANRPASRGPLSAASDLPRP